ncbi:MAG TPA: DNA polymerase III subunit chi [Rhizomicrobium sp.]|jgi:DNA polymerase-3 subunit chi
MGMTEVLFYHLEKRSLEDVLPALVERTLAHPWRSLIRTESAERAEAIDNLLWTWSEESFLPHGRMGDGDPAAQPVLITTEEGNPNGAEVVFFVGGALPHVWDDGTAGLARIVILIDGRDAAALAAARNAWSAANAFGHDVTYWKQSTGGKWEKHA